MRTFRAYLLDPSGRITWGEWIEARDLPEAEAKARELCDAGSPIVELWEGVKPLSQVPCNEDAPPRRLVNS
ncbi:hypothetical protein LRS10_23560 [Phenylobacterium sp. J426]|uniref:hypothetical protein n=1 Tax=Phenylobacterium sp. J426 TaxID=2898439 RepID=UPI0021514191|nr:hypothetical protein [Phenylobacterium sp. J426]MCR5876869.1 hypothetical protein [Phenylobacterium sp. J426]